MSVNNSCENNSATRFVRTEATILTPYLRTGAGICVVAVGLLFGAGGAVAGAESDSDNSSGASQSAGDSGQGASTSTGVAGGEAEKSTVSTAGDDTGIDATTREGESETALDSASETALENELEVTIPDTGAVDTETTVGTPVPTVPAATDASAESNSSPGSGSATPAPAPQDVLPPAEPVNPLTSALQPVSDALTARAGIINSAPGTLRALQTSPTPITDAIASVRTKVTTVIGTVGPLLQVPSNLYALLGVPPTTVPPPLIGAGPAPVGFAMPAAPVPDARLFGPVASLAPVFAPPLDDAPLFGTITPEPATFGRDTVAPAAMSAPLTVSGTVPVTVGTTKTARSLFEHVIESVLVPASLTALAAIALLGIGGLLIVAVAGVRLGYRQAKARLVLRASAIARFAQPGPIGVVQTGSIVALRQRARGPRTTRAVCPEAARQARKLEPVA